MIGNLSQFSSLYDDVSTLPASGIGSVGNLSNVFYVPNSKANLVLIGQLVDQNCVVKFSPNDCVVLNLKTRMTMAKGRKLAECFFQSRFIIICIIVFFQFLLRMLVAGISCSLLSIIGWAILVHPDFSTCSNHVFQQHMSFIQISL